MGILDEAIKEHLELKRQHGANASELKQLEDEAFGAAERPGDGDSAPDPLAEAPTQFMERPEGLDTGGEAEAALDAEAPPGVEDEPRRAHRTELADLQEPPPAPQAEQGEQNEEAEEEPVAEEVPAIEHEAVPEPVPEPEPEPDPEPQSSHTTAEREAIAEHPTEMYDIEAELGEGEPPAPAEEASAEQEDPEDFFDEQRLSDELDQALEAPPAEEDGLAADEYDEEPAPDDEEPEDEGPEAYRPAEGEEDVLEETPDFLEQAPEADRLWFEQKPPKDFDFDD